MSQTKKKTIKKKASKAMKPIHYCILCSNTGVWVKREIVFGTPGFIEIKKPCPAGCEHTKKDNRP